MVNVVLANQVVLKSLSFYPNSFLNMTKIKTHKKRIEHISDLCDNVCLASRHLVKPSVLHDVPKEKRKDYNGESIPALTHSNTNRRTRDVNYSQFVHLYAILRQG